MSQLGKCSAKNNSNNLKKINGTVGNLAYEKSWEPCSFGWEIVRLRI